VCADLYIYFSMLGAVFGVPLYLRFGICFPRFTSIGDYFTLAFADPIDLLMRSIAILVASLLPEAWQWVKSLIPRKGPIWENERALGSANLSQLCSCFCRFLLIVA